MDAFLVFIAFLGSEPAFGSAPGGSELTQAERAEGWRLLLDGRSLKGWLTSGGKPSARPVEEGSLNPHGCGDYMLVHEEEWSDFVLSLDFKITKGCNSGIFVRTSPLTPLPGKDVGYNGIEIAIDDTTGAGFHDTAAIYDLVKPRVSAGRPAGEWNHIEITCDGSLIQVELNGVDVTRMDLDGWNEPGKRPDGSAHKFDTAWKDHPRKGYIGLQDHGSDCWFKDIKILPLPAGKRREADPNLAWARRAFSADPAPGPAADRLSIVHEDVAGNTKVNRCAAGGPLRLGGKVLERGIGVNSTSVLRVSLSRPAARLLARIGLDGNVDGTAASVRFHVKADGKEVFQTEVLRPADGPRSLDLLLGGARTVELLVDDGGNGRDYDQADWADARIVLEEGTTVWLDDIARRAALGSDPPFSFIYGGRRSEELIPGWRRRLRVETFADREVRTLTLTDPQTGLEARADCSIYSDTRGVDWTLRFTNRGEKDAPILEEVKALDLSISPGIGVATVLHRLKGSVSAADDWLPFDDPVPPGAKIEFAPLGGRSSSGASPFFNLSWGEGGAVTAIGWSGQWRATVERGTSGAIRLRAGLEGVRLGLRPGETIRGPRILELLWPGGDPSLGTNLFRRTMVRHVLPKANGRAAAPPIAHLSTSFYEMNGSTEANVLSHLESIKGLGFEVFWLDAYWTRGGFPEGMGNYVLPLERSVPPDRFPRGLKPIGEAARREGLGFLLWFEPERVAPGTHIAREHPEWVISPGNDGSGLFNLGLPEARDSMTRYLIAAIKEFGLDWLRIDFNIDPLPFWRHLDGKDASRTGLAEIRYQEGLYRMWDDIREACPGLLIDNCASGGRRIDIETCSRSIPLWRTDGTIDPLFRGDLDQAALQNQVMTAGLGRYVPFSLSGQMGASPYHFRSGFNGGISFCEDCRPSGYPRDLLKAAIAEGKRLRKYILGDLHPLSDVTTSPGDWCVLQYHRPEEDDGMVVAFRRHRSPYGSFVPELREIDPSGDYEACEARGYGPSPPAKVRGEKLRRWKLEVDERPGSLLLEYRKLR